MTALTTEGMSRRKPLELYDWTYTHTCELTGAQPVVDMEVELAIEAVLEGGSLEITVGGVWQGDASLFMGDAITKAIAAAIVNAAEKEIADGGWLYQQVCDREGVEYVGLGGNDPDGHYRSSWHQGMVMGARL